MGKLCIFILLFIITGCNSNELNSDDIQLAGGHIKGCIKEEEGQTYLYNESIEVLLRSDTISVKDDLIIGKNYKIEYDYLLESNPGRAGVIDYEEISKKDYCK